ncbi:FAD-dependent oxidoreductase [Vibrio sp. Isolate31]|uniref:FAD-dependent oxidoreductase n=1 Tax=unclassified Vibrio TaxID=2614977 RepID=UPI001EFC4866|nr:MULTISPECIES: FAD-dependent oxidoreductase [unclassified Vibrio]MCG9555106.1 FAD-dependent oxidoreductase [Vibrio sp. Isolate32]MCG9602110.1 FAD-dependent oxidoreductase [Vibrio sp. Isolate31]
MSNIVIVGGGFAALQTIKMVRKLDQDIAITMITADSGWGGGEYSKPNLSHGFSQEQTPETLTVHNTQQLAEQYNVVIKTKALVSEIDIEQQYIRVDGQPIHYTKLVFATGATPFTPPAKGLKRGATITLNSLEEFEKHKAQIDDAQRVTVIGGGLIVVELAFDLQTAQSWETRFDPKGIVAKGFNADNQLVGFIVTGEHTKAAFPLLKELQTSSPT